MTPRFIPEALRPDPRPVGAISVGHQRLVSARAVARVLVSRLESDHRRSREEWLIIARQAEALARTARRMAD